MPVTPSIKEEFQKGSKAQQGPISSRPKLREGEMELQNSLGGEYRVEEGDGLNLPQR